LSIRKERGLIREFHGGQDDSKTTHPPESPDLAPSDVFLFGDVNRPLGRCPFDNADGLLFAIGDILDRFGRPTLISIFEEWMRRLQKSIDTEREYVGRPKESI
jgi:hypothetical protein